MAINADKPHLWKADIAQSVDLFNTWFMEFAPVAYRDTRVKTTESVQAAIRLTADLQSITPKTLGENPSLRASLETRVLAEPATAGSALARFSARIRTGLTAVRPRS